MSRTYDDPCGLARALDLLGERWALLLVRELLLGPKRFSQLRRGLPMASQSVLAQRLDELEKVGVVRHRTAPQRVYELTARGRELEPVLVELSRWGSRTAITSDADLSIDALALAMRTTFDGRAAGDLSARYELLVDGDSLRIDIADGTFEVTRVGGTAPTLETTAATLRSLMFGGRSLADAERAGDAIVHGDRRSLDRLLTLFPRPTPATGTT